MIIRYSGGSINGKGDGVPKMGINEAINALFKPPGGEDRYCMVLNMPWKSIPGTFVTNRS